MSPIDYLTEPLAYEFMVRALATTVLAAVVCALLSCWLVLIGWSLMGDAVSHAVLPGVVIAYILGAPFALGALVFGFGAVALIGVIRDRSRVKEDAAIGIVFTTLFALGLILISVTPSQTDLNHIIFGNILGVSTVDMIQIAVLAAIALVALLLKRRDLTLYAFDPIHAYAIGLSPRLLGALLLGLLALTTVVALQVVGMILVVAMLIIPGATAYLLTDRFGRMLIIAPTLSALCSVAGIYLSYWFDASPGGLVVVVQGVAFALVFVLGPRHGLLAGRTSTRRRTEADEREAVASTGGKMNESTVTENYLKAVWNAGEWSDQPVTVTILAAKLRLSPSSVSEVVRRLTGRGLLSHARYGAVELTPEGERIALATVRKHRLIETFLVDYLGYTWDEVHDEAEELEHAVSATFIDRLAKRLGDPEYDPHGDPIPSASGVMPTAGHTTLDAVPEGAQARIVRVPDEDPELLRHLDSVGLTIGTTVTVAGRNETAGILDVSAGASRATLALAVGRSIRVVRD